MTPIIMRTDLKHVDLLFFSFRFDDIREDTGFKVGLCYLQFTNRFWLIERCILPLEHMSSRASHQYPTRSSLP